MRGQSIAEMRLILVVSALLILGVGCSSFENPRQKSSQPHAGMAKNSLSLEDPSNEEEREKERIAEEENDDLLETAALDYKSIFLDLEGKANSERGKSSPITLNIYDPTVEQERLVKFWLHYFTQRDKERFLEHVQNGEKYRPLVESILREYNLPSDLFYLGLIESGYNLLIKSRAKAVGPWQFIAGTAKRYNMTVNEHLDERRNIFKSTHAAAQYLRDLYEMFNDWALALAAYNSGESKVLGAIRKGNTKKYSELSLQRLLPRETRYYVPKLVAVKTLLENSENSAKDKTVDVEVWENLSYYSLEVNTTVQKLVKISGLPTDILLKYNPDIKNDFIPASSRHPFRLYVPSSYLRSLAQLGPEKLQSLVTVIPITEKRKSRVSKSSKLAKNHRAMKRKGASKRASSHQVRPYIVKKGDSLFKIALRFNITLKKLLDANSLEDKTIFPKQRIYIPI